MGGTREILTQPSCAFTSAGGRYGTGSRCSRTGVAFPAAVPLGLVGVPGSFRGCRDLLTAAELPGNPGPPRPRAGGVRRAARAIPRRRRGHRPGGRGPGSPPPSAGRPPLAPVRGDRRPGAGSPPAGTPRRAGGSASRRTAAASPPHRHDPDRHTRHRKAPRPIPAAL